MPPVVVVDDVVDHDVTDIDGECALHDRRPRPVLEEQRKGDGERPDDQDDVREAAEPAIGGEALQPHVVLVLAEQLAELLGADAERVLLDQEEADHLAGEAPEMAGIVALQQLGALFEQVVDGRDRQSDGDQQGDGHQAADEEGDDAETADLARLDEKGGEADDQQRQRRKPPGGAREGEELREQQEEQQHRLEQVVGQPLGEDVAEEKRDGQSQEGSEDVRILEDAHDAAVAQEQAAVGDDVEIAADAGHRGDHGRGDIGVLDDGQAAQRRIGDERGEEECRKNQEGGGHHVDDALAADRGQLGQRQDAADEVEQQQEDERHEGPVELQAEDGPHQRDRNEQQLVGRRLVDDEAAEEDDQAERPVAQLAAEAPGGRCRAKVGSERRGAQYAFSVWSRRKGVMAMM